MIELLTVLAMAGILVAIAAPSFTAFVVNNRLATQSNELVTAFNLARSEAVTRGHAVSVCPSVSPYAACANSTDWKSGWIVFADSDGTAGTLDAGSNDHVVRIFQALKVNTLDGNAAFVRYESTGFLAAAAAPAFTLKAASCSGDRVRNIDLSLQGRPHVSRTSC